jgi:hypothetical protein
MVGSVSGAKLLTGTIYVFLGASAPVLGIVRTVLGTFWLLENGTSGDEEDRGRAAICDKFWIGIIHVRKG